jgi:hypothetical protein
VGLDWPQLAGRPEIDIRMTLEPSEPLQFSIHDGSGQKDDIIKYIKVVYSKRETRREEDKQLVIEVLSERVDGMQVVIMDVMRRIGDSRPQIGSDESSASLTDFVVVFRPVLGEFWSTYQRIWIRHTSKHCWGSIRRNENMPNVYFSASQCPYAHVAWKSLRNSCGSVR